MVVTRDESWSISLSPLVPIRPTRRAVLRAAAWCGAMVMAGGLTARTSYNYRNTARGNLGDKVGGGSRLTRPNPASQMSSSRKERRKLRSRDRGKVIKWEETMCSKKKLMNAKLMVRLIMKRLQRDLRPKWRKKS